MQFSCFYTLLTHDSDEYINVTVTDEATSLNFCLLLLTDNLIKLRIKFIMFTKMCIQL